MVKVDLEALNIEELATLRDKVIEKLAEKVTARQAELESELEKLNLYGKPVKKAPSTPVAKPVAKSKKDDAGKEPDARAA
jgi:DNA-binding protein H-NS